MAKSHLRSFAMSFLSPVYYTPSLPICEVSYKVKKQYIKSGKEVILLCDHTKFQASAFINISQLDCINRIIVGRELDVEYVDRLESLGIEVELV
nr:hypothetical protein [Enterocloster clostridioformis]